KAFQRDRLPAADSGSIGAGGPAFAPVQQRQDGKDQHHADQQYQARDFFHSLFSPPKFKKRTSNSCIFCFSACSSPARTASSSWSSRECRWVKVSWTLSSTSTSFSCDCAPAA